MIMVMVVVSGFTFTEILLCIQRCDKSFTLNNKLACDIHYSPTEVVLLCSPFPSEEMETQKGEANLSKVIYPGHKFIFICSKSPQKINGEYPADKCGHLTVPSLYRN